MQFKVNDRIEVERGDAMGRSMMPRHKAQGTIKKVLENGTFRVLFDNGLEYIVAPRGEEIMKLPINPSRRDSKQ